MSELLIGMVGDLLINRDEPDEVFAATGDLLRAPDVLFGNLEGAYTDAPSCAPGTTAVISGKARNLDAYARAGFNVVSLANNHILDVGSEAMLENRRRLNAQGVATCGAGENLAAARAPAIVEAKDLRIAVLGYASIFPFGYEAYEHIPGLAPIRAYDLWRPAIANIHQPGAAPAASTVPDDGDMARLTEDLHKARGDCDLLIATFHWGIQGRPYHLTDHERRTARFAIDNGADMVVGHHHHTIRGMEWYKGKPILYGLGHFIFDFVLDVTKEEYERQLKEFGADSAWESPYVTGPRDGWPYLPMHADMRMSMLAWAQASREGVHAIGFLPCRLAPDGVVHPLAPGSDEWDELKAYFDTANASQRLNGRAVHDPVRRVAGHDVLWIEPLGDMEP